MGKWTAGLVGTVIAGIIVWSLTKPGGALNPLAPPPVAPTAPPVQSEIESNAHPTTATATGKSPSAPASDFATNLDLAPMGDLHGHRPRRYSQGLLLRDGEQETILDGQASVGADFTHIGAEDVATLHIHQPDKSGTDHAILSAGERFEIEAAGRTCYVYVINADFIAKTIRVRIEEKR